MAQLIYYYASINAGKSALLAQMNYHYLERGMSTLLFTPEVDDRQGRGRIFSRIGISFNAYAFSETFDFYAYIQKKIIQEPNSKPTCLLVDEVQFLTAQQVNQLSDIVDFLDIDVLAYGLRSDFQGKLFTGSEALLASADNLCELTSLCHCGKKATMLLRIDKTGKALREGPQILIGGNELHLAVCRLHFKQGIAQAMKRPNIDGLKWHSPGNLTNKQEKDG